MQTMLLITLAALTIVLPTEGDFYISEANDLYFTINGFGIDIVVLTGVEAGYDPSLSGCYGEPISGWAEVCRTPDPPDDWVVDAPCGLPVIAFAANPYRIYWRDLSFDPTPGMEACFRLRKCTSYGDGTEWFCAWYTHSGPVKDLILMPVVIKNRPSPPPGPWKGAVQ